MFDFRKLSSSRALYQSNETIVSFWQERTFSYTFTCLIVIGVVPYILACRYAISSDHMQQAVVFTILYAVIILVALLRRIAYRFRFWAGILVFYILGVYSFSYLGASDTSWLYFLCFSILAVVFGKLRAGIISVLINALTVILLGKIQGIQPFDTGINDFNTTQVIFMTTFFFINTMITLSLGVLINVVETSGDEFKLLINSTSDLIWSVGSDLKINYVSPSVHSILGYGQKELIGCYIHDLVDEDQTDAFRAAIEKKEFSYETVLMHRDKTPVDVEISGSRAGRDIRSENFYQGIIKDISSKKSMEREQDRLNQELSHAGRYQAIGDLTGRVVHDLNSILSGIATYPEVLLMDTNLDETTRQGVVMIRNSGQKAADIVSDFLVISSGISADLQLLSMNQIVERFIQSAEFEDTLRSKFPNVVMDMTLDPELLLVNASYMHVEKALTGLLWFAHTQVGESGRITVSTSNVFIHKHNSEDHEIPPGEYTVLSVEDNGDPLDQNVIEHLFEPFFIKKVLGKSGTGLELCVVWNTVQDHQGYIHARSGNRGNRLAMYLPAVRMSLEESCLVVDEIKGDGEHILVVDEDRSQGKIACDILHGLGYKAWSAANGHDAVNLMKLKGADVVVFDLAPAAEDMTDPVAERQDRPGAVAAKRMETFRLIKRMYPGQKIITTVTGELNQKESRLIQDLGAKSFVKKPYTVLDMGIAIKEELEK